MDLTIRDWMVIVAVLLLLAVGIDAWRRVQRDRRSRVKMKLARTPGEANERDVDIAWLKELPNGGARVVERGDLIRATQDRDAQKKDKKDRAAQDTAQDRAAKPDPGNQESAAAAGTNQGDTPPAPAGQTAQNPAVKPAPKADDEEQLVTGISSAGEHDEPGTLDWLDSVGAADDTPVSAVSAADKEGRLPRDVAPEVFMLNVVARDKQGFRGEDILHILLACDLRFGDMNFFHRHEFKAGRGPIQFSVANMMRPGVFDIDNMADFNTPGLVFFLTLPGPEDMMKAFDYMLETAQAVARNLEGDVLDESRSVVTRQTLEHCRQQIRDLERRMLARAH